MKIPYLMSQPKDLLLTMLDQAILQRLVLWSVSHVIQAWMVAITHSGELKPNLRCTLTYLW